jgi:hypothetical protein
VAGGAKLETLLTTLRERERRREQLRAQLAALDTARQVAGLDVGRMRKHLGALLDDWRGLLLGNPAQTRQAVLKLVPERLVFSPITTPEGDRVYEFRGEGRLDPILHGLVTGVLNSQLPKAVVAPRGLDRRGSDCPPCPVPTRRRLALRGRNSLRRQLGPALVVVGNAAATARAVEVALDAWPLGWAFAAVS